MVIKMYKLLPENTAAFLDLVSEKQKLYIPKDCADGQARYALYERGDTLSGAVNTVRSAKDFFFPQTENLVDFKLSGKQIEVTDVRSETEDFVLFGVRACDARSFKILDRVFIDAEPSDSYYKNRREHGTIIVLGCEKPTETCFCHSFGIDPTDSDDCDIMSWRTESGFIMNAVTEKGRALLRDAGQLLLEADPADEALKENQRKKTDEILSALPLGSLNTKDFDGKNMMEAFSSEKWSGLSEACLGCGTCTFVCPTCQCYDIKDFDTGHGIKRFRCWDSCMYSEFTKMAGGQPRITQKERFRQRFMHKLVYFPMNNDGVYGCVGCGRCLSKCPIHMNIVKVMKSLSEVEE